MKMKSPAAIIYGLKSLTIVAKLSILDICRRPGYTSACSMQLVKYLMRHDETVDNSF